MAVFWKTLIFFGVFFVLYISFSIFKEDKTKNKFPDELDLNFNLNSSLILEAKSLLFAIKNMQNSESNKYKQEKIKCFSQKFSETTEISSQISKKWANVINDHKFLKNCQNNLIEKKSELSSKIYEYRFLKQNLEEISQNIHKTNTELINLENSQESLVISLKSKIGAFSSSNKKPFDKKEIRNKKEILSKEILSKSAVLAQKQLDLIEKQRILEENQVNLEFLYLELKENELETNFSTVFNSILKENTVENAQKLAINVGDHIDILKKLEILSSESEYSSEISFFVEKHKEILKIPSQIPNSIHHNTSYLDKIHLEILELQKGKMHLQRELSLLTEETEKLKAIIQEFEMEMERLDSELLMNSSEETIEVNEKKIIEFYKEESKIIKEKSKFLSVKKLDLEKQYEEKRVALKENYSELIELRKFFLDFLNNCKKKERIHGFGIDFELFKRKISEKFQEIKEILA